MQAVTVDNAAVEALKTKGNAAFSKQNFPEAIMHFTEAIKLDGKNEVLYSNRSAAYTQMKNATDLQLALQDANECINLKPSWVKGYARKATALFFLKDYPAAKETYLAGLKLDANDQVLVKGLQQVELALKGGDQKKGKKQRKGKKTADAEEEEEEKEVNHVIGIDLGTTYSCVGVWQNNSVTMIPNERGDITTPSYVSFSKSGKRTVGHAAKADAHRYPTSTIYDIKRVIGQSCKDQGVEQDIRRFPFPIVEGENGKPNVVVDMGHHGKKMFAPEEISAFVLSYLKKSAERFLKVPVKQAVITVPAYFNDAQRAATKAAGAIAGLEVLRIINEPTAAALSYGLDNKAAGERDGGSNILVFDLGGGTFDVSILSIENGLFEVKATGGDTRLGGEDFDHLTAEYLIKASNMPEIANDTRAMKRLKAAVEKAKRELSSTDKTFVSVEAIFPKGDGRKQAVDFHHELTRAEFEKANKTLFNRCIDTVKAVLKDAKMEPKHIHDIVLVGGSTRIPRVQEQLVEFFNGKKLCKALNPDEAVAYGAAVQGAILSGKRTKETKDLLLMDVTPISLGIETVGRVMSVIIPRNTPIPTVKTQCYTTEENFQTAVDICVYEGENAKTDENHLLGKFTITGIERAKKGEPKVDVSFAMDSNGILNVTAKDQKTGVEEKIMIDRNGGTSESDVAKMAKDAEAYRKEDEEDDAKADAQNALEALVYKAQDAVKANKGSTEAREALNKAASSTEAWLENASTASLDDLTSKTTELESLLAKLTL